MLCEPCCALALHPPLGSTFIATWAFWVMSVPRLSPIVADSVARAGSNSYRISVSASSLLHLHLLPEHRGWLVGWRPMWPAGRGGGGHESLLIPPARELLYSAARLFVSCSVCTINWFCVFCCGRYQACGLGAPSRSPPPLRFLKDA